jgi:hypothetical protein
VEPIISVAAGNFKQPMIVHNLKKVESNNRRACFGAGGAFRVTSDF